MRTFHKLDDVPRDFGPALLSVGNFDGVHRAHRHVLDEIVRRAKAGDAQSVAVTFEPHPARILRPDHNLKLLTPAPEKLRLLEATGIDAVLLLPFSRDLSLMTPHQFAHEILKKRLHAREVHEGYNFRFGHKAAGNIHLLRDLGREMGFEPLNVRIVGDPPGAWFSEPADPWWPVFLRPNLYKLASYAAGWQHQATLEIGRESCMER